MNKGQVHIMNRGIEIVVSRGFGVGGVINPVLLRSRGLCVRCQREMWFCGTKGIKVAVASKGFWG